MGRVIGLGMPAHRTSSRALASRAARRRLTRLALLASSILSCIAAPRLARAQTFQLSYPAGANAGPITGRAFLFVARTDKEEPRLQSGPDRGSEPFFGVDVEALAAGQGGDDRPDRPRLPRRVAQADCPPATTSCRG